MDNILQTRILLVEDYQPSVLMLEILFEEWGTCFEVAKNGSEAFNKATENSYDLILMDVNMPITCGYEATKLIREHEIKHNKPQTFIIGMTANAFIGDMEKCLNVGMNDYIPKPINITDLEMKIKSHIKNSTFAKAG